MAKPLGDDLAKHIMKGDSLLVQEVGKDAAWIKLQITKEEMTALLDNCRF